MRFTALAEQSAAGESWEVKFTPPARYLWKVRHMAITIPGWISGTVRASVYVDEVFECDTAQGHRSSGDGDPIDVHDGQYLRVVWEPLTTNPAAPLVMVGDMTPTGIVTITVDAEEMGR